MLGMIVYLGFVIGLAVFCVLYIDSFAVILLLCALLIPLLLGLTFLITHRKGRAELSCNLAVCRSGDSIPVTLTVENRGILPFSHMQGDVALKHLFGECDEELSLRFPLQARNLTRVTFYVHAEYAGTLSIRMKRLFIRDYFHLFSMKFPMPEKTLELTVMPAVLPMPIALDAPAVYTPEGDHFGDHPGDDPSEIFDLRNYHEGDLMSRIHWKLSARRDELIYKELSYPEEHRVMLLFDYEYHEPCGRAQFGRQIDGAFSLLYAISSFLLSKEVPHSVLWFDLNNNVQITEISAAEALLPVFRCFFDKLSFVRFPERRLLDLLPGEAISSFVWITNRVSAAHLRIIDTELTAFRKTVFCTECPDGVSAEQTKIVPIPNPIAAGTVPQLLL